MVEDQELQRAVGRIEGKLDMLIEQTKGSNKRLSAVEKKVWWASGAGAVIGWIGSKVVT